MLEGPKAWSNKTGINFMIHTLIFMKNYLQIWPKTGSNPADINRFRSYTGDEETIDNHVTPAGALSCGPVSVPSQATWPST